MPSPRPVKPNRSVVVALTLTFLMGTASITGDAFLAIYLGIVIIWISAVVVAVIKVRSEKEQGSA